MTAESSGEPAKKSRLRDVPFYRNVVRLSQFRSLVDHAIESHEHLGRLAKFSAEWGRERLGSTLSEPEKGLTGQKLFEIMFHNEFLKPHQEFITRAAYVVAWAAFEDLFGTCVKLVFLAKPSLLDSALSKQDDKRSVAAGVILKGFLVQDLTREDVVERLADLQIAALRLGQTLEGLVNFCQDRLHVEIDPNWLPPLDVVLSNRNEAAHDPDFDAVPHDEMKAQLTAFRDSGVAIATACIDRYKLRTQDDVLKEMQEKYPFPPDLAKPSE